MAKYYGEQPGWAQQVTQRPDDSLWGYNYSGDYGNLYKDANDEWNFRDEFVAEAPISLPETKTDKPEPYYGDYIKSFSDLGITEKEFQRLIGSGFVKEGTDYHDMVTGSLTFLGKSMMSDATSEEHGYEIMLNHPGDGSWNYDPGTGFQDVQTKEAGSGTGNSYLENHNILGPEGVDIDPNQLIQGLGNAVLQNTIESIFGVDKRNRSPTIIDYFPNLINQAPTNKQDMLIASAGDLTGLLGEKDTVKDTVTDADRIAKQEEVIKKAGFGIVRPQDRMRTEKKEPGVFNTITDWISDRVGGAKATSAEIALSSLTGKTTQGDFTKDQLLKFGTNRAGTDLITQRHEAIAKENPKKFDTPFGDPQIPFYRGEKPTISDDSLYIDSRTGEALPQTDATRVDFPDHSVQYGDSGQIGGRGAVQAFVHQKDPWSMPTFNVHDIAATNFASKDSGEFSAGGLGSKVTEGVAKGLAWLGGSKWSDRQSEGVNVGGVSHKQGVLPYTEWSPEMKQAYAPHLEFKTDGRLGHGPLSPDYDNPDWNEQVSSALKAFDSGPPQEGMKFWSEISPGMSWDYGGDLKGSIPDALNWGWEYPTSNQDNLDQTYIPMPKPTNELEAKYYQQAQQHMATYGDHQREAIANWNAPDPNQIRLEYTGGGTEKFTENLWGINPGELAKTSGRGSSAKSWDKYANFGHA